MSDKPWAVVRDMSPFGLHVLSEHFTRAGAEFRLAYLRDSHSKVMRTEDARATDREIVESAAKLYGFDPDSV